MQRFAIAEIVLILALILVAPAFCGAKPEKIQVEVRLVSSVTCEDDSVVFELQTRVTNLTGTTIRLGDVGIRAGQRIYREGAGGKLTLLRTEDYGEEGGAAPPFDIINGKYQVPDEPLQPHNSKSYTKKTGFQIKNGDVEVSAQGRKLIASFFVVNVLPKEQPSRSYAWGYWTNPVTIWIPQECKLPER